VRGRGSALRGLLGGGISLVALVLVVASVDPATTWATLRTADPRWVLALGLFIVLDLVLRIVRWHVLLAPVQDVPFRTTGAALLVGYLANNVLPARLGELVRVHVLGERTAMSRSTILGTVVVERIVDTAVVVAIASGAIVVLSVRGVVASAVWVGLAITGFLAVAVVVALAAHRLPGADRVTKRLESRPLVTQALRGLRDGLAVARRPRTLSGAVVLSIASWSSTVLAFAAAAQAVGIHPTLGQAALLAAGTNLATAVPSAPGYVGTFELATVAIARSVGIDGDAALAFAILVHAAVLLITSIGGALVIVRGGLGRLTLRAAATADGSGPQSA